MEPEIAEVVPLFGDRGEEMRILVQVFEVDGDGTRTLVRSERVVTSEKRMRLAS